MPEEVESESGVKVVSEVSPASEPQVATVETPAEEHSVQSEPETQGHVPYLRFKEINDKYKSLKAELEKVHSEKLASHKVETSETADDEQNEVDQMSKYASRLAEKGFDPKISSALSEVMKDIAKEESKARFAKETARAEASRAEKAAKDKEIAEKSQKEITEWQTEFRKAHPDYAKYEPQMQKEWEALDPSAKMTLVSSPKSYELLYKVAKAADVDGARAEGEEAGRTSAYETKTLKSALSSLPGATANSSKKYTPEDVAKMSAKEYTDNREKIMSDLGLKK